MCVTTEMIKELRQQTGAGVLNCKKALEEAGADMAKATEILRERGMVAAAKKADRVASEGLIEAYIHAGAKLGTLVEVNCETDFVARTADFQSLCHDLAMQVAGASPRWVSREDIPAAEVAAKKAEFMAEVEPGKPENIVERIIDGKLAKFYRETCMLEQNYIKDEDKTIEQLVAEAIAKLGENIVIKRIARFQIG